MSDRQPVVYGLAVFVVAFSACRLGGGDMPRAAPEVLVTDSRTAFEIDPLLDVTLPPVDAGGDAEAVPPAPAASSYRAADAGVGAETPRDVSGPPQPQKPAAPPPLEKPRPPQATQSAQLPSAPPPPKAQPQPQPQPTQPPPMPGMQH